MNGSWAPIRIGADGAEQAISSGAASSRPAGFWRRAVALAVDLSVVWFLWHVGRRLVHLLDRRSPVVMALSYTCALVVPAAYFVLAHGTGGQTFGKRLMGARVVGASGEPIGYLRALGRLLAACLSAALLGLGFLVVAVRRDRRALHDLIAGTRVVRSRGPALL